MLTSCQILILVVLKLLLPYQESRAISFRIKIQRKSGQSKFLIYSCVSCLTRSLSLVAMPLIFHDTCDIYKRTAAQIVTNLRDLHPFASSMIGNIKLTTDNSAEWLGAKEGVFISYEFLIIRFDLSHQSQTLHFDLGPTGQAWRPKQHQQRCQNPRAPHGRCGNGVMKRLGYPRRLLLTRYDLPQMPKMSTLKNIDSTQQDVSASLLSIFDHFCTKSLFAGQQPCCFDGTWHSDAVGFVRLRRMLRRRRGGSLGSHGQTWAVSSPCVFYMFILHRRLNDCWQIYGLFYTVKWSKSKPFNAIDDCKGGFVTEYVGFRLWGCSCESGKVSKMT